MTDQHRHAQDCVSVWNPTSFSGRDHIVSIVEKAIAAAEQRGYRRGIEDAARVAEGRAVGVGPQMALEPNTIAMRIRLLLP